MMSSTVEFRVKQRSVIEFLAQEGCTPIEIHRRMKALYGESCMDVKNVRQWVRRAKSCSRGKMSVFDEQRSGRPITVTHAENQRRVSAMIRENRRIRQRDIALKLEISQERVQHIMETLNYSKEITNQDEETIKERNEEDKIKEGKVKEKKKEEETSIIKNKL